MMLKNLKDNAKNLAANAKIEDMSRLFKNHMAGKQDVKNALSGVMVSTACWECVTFNNVETVYSNQ
jgi:hypothetical protein